MENNDDPLHAAARQVQAACVSLACLCLSCLAPQAVEPAHSVATPPRAQGRTLRPFVRPCSEVAAYEVWAANAVVADGARPGALLAVRQTHGVFASPDGGYSWQLLGDGDRCNAPAEGFFVNASVPGSLCLQAHNEGSPVFMELYCSTDGGHNFVQLVPPRGFADFADVPVCDAAAPGRLYAVAWGLGCTSSVDGAPCDTLLWSQDGGVSWSASELTAPGRLQLALSRDLTPTLFVARNDARMRFTDLQACHASTTSEGALKLACEQRLQAADACAHETLVALQVNPLRGELLLLDWGEAGWWVSHDGGHTCKALQMPDAVVDAPMFAGTTGPWGVMARLAWDDVGALLLLSRDGGDTWVPSEARPPGFAGELSAAGYGEILFMTGSALYRSANEGKTWMALTLP